jgi:hypothetical protein
VLPSILDRVTGSKSEPDTTLHAIWAEEFMYETGSESNEKWIRDTNFRSRSEPMTFHSDKGASTGKAEAR